MADKNWLTIGLIVLVAYLLYTSGALQGLLGGAGTGGGGTGFPDLPPSDKKTTITLNTKDALKDPALGANVSYYVFTSGGAFYKEGSTTAGQVSFDLDSGTVDQTRSWTMIAYDDDDSGNDYYPETVTFTTGTESMKTVNVLLYKEGSAKVTAVLNPVDNSHNISTAAGATESFDAWWKVNETDTAYKNPMAVLEVNRTCTDTVRCAGTEEITCPKFVSDTTSQFKKYCFRKEGMFTSEMSSSETVFHCNIEYAASVACPGSPEGNITINMNDESMYKEADYTTKGKEAFKVGAVDPADLSNIGDQVETSAVAIWLGG